MQGTWRWINGFIVVLVLASYVGIPIISPALACRAIYLLLFFLTHEVPFSSSFILVLQAWCFTETLGFVFRFRSPPISFGFLFFVFALRHFLIIISPDSLTNPP